MGICLKITGKKETIELTHFSITNYIIQSKRFNQKASFLSRDTNSITLEGKINLFDESSEINELHKLTIWSEYKAHDEDCYRRMDIEFTDVNNEITDIIRYEKGFIVNYLEQFSFVKGVGTFKVLIREFDRVEVAMKK